MKRLIVPIVTIVAVLAAPLTFAQSRDLAGKWVLDVEKSGSKDGPPVVVITLTDKEFTVRMGADTAPVMTFKLDGTETAHKAGKTKAAWKGARLEATLSTETRSETLSFSRDGSWLVVESLTSDVGPKRLFFKKAPAS